MKWPSPKVMSAICLVLNLGFGINALAHSQYLFAVMCFLFAAYCMNNFYKQ
jgi:hypothetical protein